MKSKQELADYRLLCVLCLGTDKLEETYTRDVAMETQAEAEKVECQRCEIHTGVILSYNTATGA